MKREVVIVTGSRHWTDREEIMRRLRRYPKETILIHGDWDGADKLADSVGRELGFHVLPIPYFGEFGFAGGPLRNALMVALGEAFRSRVEFLAVYQVTVEAFPLPQSKGTKNCIRLAEEAGLRVERE